VRTIKLWFDCATLIFERLETLGVTPAQSLLLTGHSYGAAACSIVALRTMLANPTQEVFLLTYGMPKPCDQAGMEVLDALHRIHVFNTGDVVPQIPLAVYQSQWFLGVISDVLVRKWGAWAQSEEYLIQSIGGRKELNHLPGLTADVLQPLLSTVFIDHRIPTIQAHKISEYVLRSCLGCDCPRWPFLQPEWDILFSDQCGGRGFRFAADVINRTFGGEPHGRYRFSSAVRDVPPIPGNCYYLCLDASSSQYAGSPVLPIFGIPQLTIMFRARRLGTDNGGIVSVDAATENRLELTSADAFDGNIYAIVGRGDSVAFGRTPVEPGHLWHHYAMVFDGTQTGDTARLKVYVDGVERTLTYFGVGIPALTPSTPGAENIGRAPGSFFTTGDMDDVAIFTSALSATDVADIASRAQDPTAFDPLQLLRFEEGEGTVAHDTSGNGHDVTLFNGASFCFDVCLARSAARYKFKALVIVVDPVVGITLGKYKFAGRVHEGDPVGDPVEGKFRFSSYVGSVEGPGDPIEGKFKFSHSIWTRTVAGSTLSIQFVASEGQSLTWDNAVGGGGPGQTIYFWAKRDGSGNSGIYSVGGQGDPQSVCELSVIYSAGTLGVIGRVSCYVEEELFSTVGRSGLPVDNSWHHYAMVFQTGFGGDPNSMQLYIDGEPVHTTIEPQAVPFEFVRGGGIDNVGVDSLGNFTNGKMDNVVWAQFALTDGQIHGIANADLDPADVGGFVILRWEMDTGGLAWQDFIYDWVDGFVGSPSHSTDVPPLLKD
jgi:hypothetical protein